MVLFSNEVLTAWINRDFASNSKVYLQVFSIGILINCMSHIPYTLIQGTGRSKLTAYFHLIQFPIYFLLLWILVLNYGVLGAAIAWLIRILLDSVLMFLGAFKLMGWRLSRKNKYQFTYLIILFTILFAIIMLANPEIYLKAFILLLVCITSIYYSVITLNNILKIK